MAKETKYDTHIKPFLKDITKMYEVGYSERDIYETLRVSHDFWFRCKKDKKELNDALNIKAKIKKEIDDLIEFKKTSMPIKKYNELIEKKLQIKTDDNGNEILPSLDTILKALRQQYPVFNHYLQIEKDKNKVSWFDAETKRMQIDNDKDKPINQIIISNDVINRD